MGLLGGEFRIDEGYLFNHYLIVSLINSHPLDVMIPLA